MKRSVFFPMLILFFAALTVTVSAQEVEPKKADGALLRLEPENVDLGEIALDKLSSKDGKVKIVVHNDGSKPLILQKVEGCCGTEVKSYPKGPILPGKEGEIHVEFRIEPKPQSISRTVTIHSNSGGGSVVKARIFGSVVVPKRPGRIEL